MKKVLFGVFAFAVFAMGSMSVSAQGKTVVDIAVGSPDHTTLVAAVKAADLVGTLSGAGPFTVFAPTDQAGSYSNDSICKPA